MDHHDTLALPVGTTLNRFIIYGSSPMLVYTTGNGVNGFTYENSLGEFVLSHPNIMTPATGTIYSVNEGMSQHYSTGMAAAVAHGRQSQQRPPTHAGNPAPKATRAVPVFHRLTRVGEQSRRTTSC